MHNYRGNSNNRTVLFKNSVWNSNINTKHVFLIHSVDSRYSEGQMKRVDQQTFDTIKKPLLNRFTRPQMLAKKYDLSLKTILQIRGSQNYPQYVQQNKAQHPPIKYSLRDEVLWLHDLTFNKNDNKYIQPPTARKAIEELINAA